MSAIEWTITACYYFRFTQEFRLFFSLKKKNLLIFSITQFEIDFIQYNGITKTKNVFQFRSFGPNLNF